MNDSLGTIGNPLKYQDRPRFPPGLELAYRKDFANRAIKMQRQFIVFGFFLYGLFSILDYYAMPRTHQTAWILRALLEPFVAVLFLVTYKQTW